MSQEQPINTMMHSMFEFTQTMGRMMASTMGETTLGTMEQMMTQVMSQFMTLGGRVSEPFVASFSKWVTRAVTENDPIIEPMVTMMHRLSINGSEMIPAPVNRRRAQALANRLLTFYHFREASNLTGFIPGETSLVEAMARADALGPRRSVWVMEGIGHALGLAAVKNPFLATAIQDPALPDRCMIPLHVGLGLALSTSLLADGFHDLDMSLSQWQKLCDLGARKGYGEAIREPLGMTVHVHHPEQMSAVADVLVRTDAKSHELFWHGVGRSVYFWPGNMVPMLDPDERALNRCLGLTKEPIARCNLVAGLTWAMLLVNLHQCQIVEGFLARHGQGPYVNAMTNGIASGLMTWRQSCPDDPAMNTFLQYQPSSLMKARWKHMVTDHAAHALEIQLPILKQQGAYTSFFRFDATNTGDAP